MSQNRSSAVMQQRSEPHDSLDFFPTPLWATRALCEALYPGEAERLKEMQAWEPACGQGHMARPLSEYFGHVYASDVHDYGFGDQVDFLMAGERPCFDWIITNPPFRLASQFATEALTRARRGVALLVRTAFLEGGERYRSLFAPHPPTVVLQFCERVPMVKGRYDPAASTATSYCWIVWAGKHTDASRTFFEWIPPCRKQLERASDYELPVAA